MLTTFVKIVSCHKQEMYITGNLTHLPSANARDITLAFDPEVDTMGRFRGSGGVCGDCNQRHSTRFVFGGDTIFPSSLENSMIGLLTKCIPTKCQCYSFLFSSSLIFLNGIR